jgi:hypothetical protein
MPVRWTMRKRSTSFRGAAGTGPLAAGATGRSPTMSRDTPAPPDRCSQWREREAPATLEDVTLFRTALRGWAPKRGVQWRPNQQPRQRREFDKRLVAQASRLRRRCPHGYSAREKCALCPEGKRLLCEHNRWRRNCVECEGSATCFHRRNKYKCRECR